MFASFVLGKVLAAIPKISGSLHAGVCTWNKPLYAEVARDPKPGRSASEPPPQAVAAASASSEVVPPSLAGPSSSRAASGGAYQVPTSKAMPISNPAPPSEPPPQSLLREADVPTKVFFTCACPHETDTSQYERLPVEPQKRIIVASIESPPFDQAATQRELNEMLNLKRRRARAKRERSRKIAATRAVLVYLKGQVHAQEERLRQLEEEHSEDTCTESLD